MAIKLSVSHDNDVVALLLKERLIDPNFGEQPEQGVPPRPMVFAVLHREGDNNIFLFLRFDGHKSDADNVLSAYLIEGDSPDNVVEEATKIYLSIKDGMGYHKTLRPSALRPTSSWYPRLSQFEWRALEERGEVAGLTSAHWYEVFLSFNDAASLERLGKFYTRPPGDTERLIEIVTDARVLDYFTTNPDAFSRLRRDSLSNWSRSFLADLGTQVSNFHRREGMVV